MKKLRNISKLALAVAGCLFALNANANATDELYLWMASNSSGQDLHYNSAEACITFINPSSCDPWCCQFNPPTWYAPSKTGNETFTFSFDAKYEGEGTDGDNTGRMTFIHGRQFGGLGGFVDLETLCNQLGIEQVEAYWMISGNVDQLLVDDYTGVDVDPQYNTQYQFTPGLRLTRNVNFYPTSKWQHFEFSGTLGRHAKDSVDLEWDFGRVPGTYSIKNVMFNVGDKTFAAYFMEEDIAGINYEKIGDEVHVKNINYIGATSITIPETYNVGGTDYPVTTIDENAFAGCTSLKSITIPESITSVGRNAFKDCNSLTKINIASDADFSSSVLRFRKGNDYQVLDKNTVQYIYQYYTTPPPLTVKAGNTFTVEDYYEGWIPRADVYVNPTTGVATIIKDYETADTWDCQFNPPTWYAPSRGISEQFEISFDARYLGDGTDGDEKGHITFIQGRQFGGVPSSECATLCEQLGIDKVDAGWEIQGKIEQLLVDDYTGKADDPHTYQENWQFDVGNRLCRKNVNFYPTSEWQNFSFTGTLGRHAADSVDLQWEFGTMAGEYDMKNVVFKVNGKTFAAYFMEEDIAGINYEKIGDEVHVKNINYIGATSITIPATYTINGQIYPVTTIDENAFAGCTSLKSISIPESITSVGRNAFKDCNSLTKINIASDADFSSSVLRFSKNGSTYQVLDKNTVQYTYDYYNYTRPPQTVTAGNTFTVKDYYEGWIPRNSDVYVNPTTNIVTIINPEVGDPWSCMFNPPTWYEPGKGKNEPFEISFDARYIGDGTNGNEKGHITFCQGWGVGRFSGNNEAMAALCEQLGIDKVDAGWKIQSKIEQLLIDDYTGKADDPQPYQDYDIGNRLCRNVNFYPTSEWQNFSFTGTLGRHAADSVDLEWEFGTIAGEYEIKNVVFKVGGKVFAEYFTKDEAKLVESGEFVYETNGHNAIVKLCKDGTANSVTIPATIIVDGREYTVTAIADNAFSGCGKMQSVTIPKTVETIATDAFNDCKELKTIVVETGNTNFATKDGVLYDADMTTLIRCPQASTVCVIPNTVTTIAGSAFNGCTEMPYIYVPESVTNIADGAFRGVNTTIYCESENNLAGIDGNVVGGAKISGDFIYSADIQGVCGYIGESKDVTIPETLKVGGRSCKITAIGEQTFNCCPGLLSLTIPASVTEIDNAAFVGCDNLKTLTYNSNGVGKCFAGCKSLESVTVGDDVRGIDAGAFKDCNNLKSITIGISVSSIGEKAFYNCHALQSVDIGGSVMNIGKEAFQGCHKIKTISVPSQVLGIGEDAFKYVKNIEYEGNAKGEPWGALTVNGYKEGDFIFTDATKKCLTAYVGSGSAVEVPSTVTVIAHMAFFEAEGLKSVTIHGSVKKIENLAFANCFDLKEVNVPKSVLYVGKEAFRDSREAEIRCAAPKKPIAWHEEWAIKVGKILWSQPDDTIGVGITDEAADGVTIYATGNTIVVENATDEIRVYNAMGKLVGRDVARNVSTIRINNSGVYIVRTGNVAKRVVVK